MSQATRWGIAAAAALALAPAVRAGDTQQKGAKNASVHDNSALIPGLFNANVAEIEAAKVAEKNAQSQAVKDFAKQIQKDHGQVKDALAKLAKERNVKLDESAAKKANQAHLDQMKNMKGAQMDQHFPAMMASTHEKDLKNVDAALRQANETGDHELAQVLENAKPKMEAHHRTALALEQGKGTDQRQGRRPSSSSSGATETNPATSPSTSGSTGNTGTDTGSGNTSGSQTR